MTIHSQTITEDSANGLQDIEAEKATLGAMMMSRDACDEVFAIIGPADAFTLPAHRHLFDALRAVHDAGRPMDLTVVTEELRRRDVVGVVGGDEYMVELAESFGDYANAKHYAEIVRDRFVRRMIARLASSLSAEVRSLHTSPDVGETAGKFVADVEGVVQSLSGGSHLQRVTDLLPDLHKSILGGETTRLRCGIGALDDLLGGFDVSSFIVLAGRTSRGKTSLALNMAAATSQQGNPVLLFSLEMSRSRLAARMVGLCSGKDRYQLARSSPDEVYHYLNYTGRCLAKAPILVTDTVYRLSAVKATIRTAVRKHGVRFVIVDYMQLVEPEGKFGTRTEAVQSISRTFKRMAQELPIVLVALAQFNREAAPGVKPTLNHLRESGSIEQDADAVLFIHPHDEASWERMPDPDVDVIVAKNRDGVTGSVSQKFDKRTMRFSTLLLNDGGDPVEDSPW